MGDLLYLRRNLFVCISYYTYIIIYIFIYIIIYILYITYTYTNVLADLRLNYLTQFYIIKHFHAFKSRGHLEDLGVDGKRVLKCIYKSGVCNYGLYKRKIIFFIG
jgi:hypothetical protein